MHKGVCTEGVNRSRRGEARTEGSAQRGLTGVGGVKHKGVRIKGSMHKGVCTQRCTGREW
jgi:hypothetical protein